MCMITQLPDKKYKARFFEANDGFIVQILPLSFQAKTKIFIGRPREIKKNLLWKNAYHGYLGVKYKTWPWWKKALARSRIIICRLRLDARPGKQILPAIPSS